MGTFRVGCRIQHIADRAKVAKVDRLLVDTGSDYTWLPGDVLTKLGVERVKKDIAFTMANGQTITRTVGYVIIHCDKFQTVDEVVFAEPGEMSLLGADARRIQRGGGFKEEEARCGWAVVRRLEQRTKIED